MKYVTPEMTVTELQVQDVITLSSMANYKNDDIGDGYVFNDFAF